MLHYLTPATLVPAEHPDASRRIEELPCPTMVSGTHDAAEQPDVGTVEQHI